MSLFENYTPRQIFEALKRGMAPELKVDVPPFPRVIALEIKSEEEANEIIKLIGSRANPGPLGEFAARIMAALICPEGICSHCTDANCSGCIESTGLPCSWVNDRRTLCSACAEAMG